MKTFEELLWTEPVFEGEFSCEDDVFNNFCIGKPTALDFRIIYASYECPPYEGYATVLFIENGELYEVHGSHCSCYGLENQWEPEKVTLKELQFRFENGEQVESVKQAFGY